jgi:hypothetical protein
MVLQLPRAGSHAVRGFFLYEAGRRLRVVSLSLIDKCGQL